MMPDETPADRLRTAAPYIRDHHGRGMLVDADGRTCAVGAILQLRNLTEYSPTALLFNDRTADRAVTALAGYLRQAELGPKFECQLALVEEWSDNAEDGVQVAEVMEKAAAWWEETR